VRRYLPQPLQGRKAAKVRELFWVCGGPLHSQLLTLGAYVGEDGLEDDEEATAPPVENRQNRNPPKDLLLRPFRHVLNKQMPRKRDQRGIPIQISSW